MTSHQAMQQAREALATAYALINRNATISGDEISFQHDSHGEAVRGLRIAREQAVDAIVALDRALSQPSDEARDAARWRFAAALYDGVKRSRGRNALDALGIDADECDSFANIIDAAQAKDGAR